MKNQRGFSAVEGLIIVLVLCVVGFAGYTVWNNSQEDDAESNQSNAAQEVTQESNDLESSDVATEIVTAPSDWEIFTDNETRKFSMSIPDGWKIYDHSSTTGFFSLGYQDNLSAPAEIIETEAGKAGPFLFYAGYSEIDNTQYYGTDDASWENKYNLDATRYVNEITENSTDGRVGDTSYTYVFDAAGGSFNFGYLMSPGAADSLDDVELALSSLSLN